MIAGDNVDRAFTGSGFWCYMWFYSYRYLQAYKVVALKRKD